MPGVREEAKVADTKAVVGSGGPGIPRETGSMGRGKVRRQGAGTVLVTETKGYKTGSG